jgi:uncharacterized protein (DUF488 family)
MSKRGRILFTYKLQIRCQPKAGGRAAAAIGLAWMLHFKLLALQPTAIMCAESRWWRCHRALIADYFTVQGVTVIHIMAEAASRVHPFTAAAHLRDGRLSYAAEDCPDGKSVV